MNTTDPDGETEGAGLTYSIVASIMGGAVDGSFFAINPNTGALTFSAAPNFEAPADSNIDNIYDVTVRVTDSAGMIDDQVISVTVTDANDAPVGVADALTVAEGATATILTGGATSVLVNDTDADNNALNAIFSGQRAGERQPDAECQRHVQLHPQRLRYHDRQLHLSGQ